LKSKGISPAPQLPPHHAHNVDIEEINAMPPVRISEDAMGAIVQGFKEAEPVNIHGKGIPLLVWSSRTYSDDKLGNHTEFGSMFFFSWTDDNEIDQNHYLTMDIADGQKLALAPNAIFQSGSHRIEQIDNRLTLVSD
jgi:hypothetical protein